jgi:diamine N-acetyltransferase
MTNTVADDRPEGALAIRRATIADAGALSEFAAHVFYETFAPDNDPIDMNAYLLEVFTPEKQAEEIADPQRIYLIAEVGGAMVGYALLRLDAPDPETPGDQPVELQRFYVDHAWHGRGVASPFLAACARTARARGGTTIWLGVWERNARAIRFYAKHGFTDIGSKSFRLGYDLQTDRVMSRSIVARNNGSA